jgi:hypothetical protein
MRSCRELLVIPDPELLIFLLRYNCAINGVRAQLPIRRRLSTLPTSLPLSSELWYTPGRPSVNLAREGYVNPLHSRVYPVHLGETSGCRKP